MGKVSESIWSDGNLVIPMADVQHIEKKCRSTGSLIGAFVITKHTIWNQDMDKWGNSIWLNKDQTERFICDWSYYRHELEKDRSLEVHEKVGDYEKRVKIMYVADAEKTNQLENEIKKIKTHISGIGEQIPRISELEKYRHEAGCSFDSLRASISRCLCYYTGLKDDRDKLNERANGLAVRTTSIEDKQGGERKRLSVAFDQIIKLTERIESLEKNRHEVKAVSETYNRINRWTDQILILEKRADEVVAKFITIWDRVLKIENEIKKIGILFLESIGSRDALNSRLDGLVDRILVLEKQTEGAEGDQIGKLWSRILKLENEKGEIGRLNVVFEHIGDLTKRVKELEEKK